MRQLSKTLAAALALLLILGLAIPIRAAEAKGRITSVSPDSNEFVLSENVKDLKFRLLPDGKVFINGKAAKLAEMQAGDEAIVTYTREGQQLNASAVHCKREPRAVPGNP